MKRNRYQVKSWNLIALLAIKFELSLHASNSFTSSCLFFHSFNHSKSSSSEFFFFDISTKISLPQNCTQSKSCPSSYLFFSFLIYRSIGFLWFFIFVEMRVWPIYFAMNFDIFCFFRFVCFRWTSRHSDFIRNNRVVNIHIDGYNIVDFVVFFLFFFSLSSKPTINKDMRFCLSL